MRSGTKHLRIASVLQIVLGLLSFVLANFLLQEGDVAAAGVAPEQALWILTLTKGGYLFQIFAGVVGLLLANKKSVLTVLLGILLFLPTLATFLQVKGDILLIVLNAIALAIPYYYLHNAYKNFKS